MPHFQECPICILTIIDVGAVGGIGISLSVIVPGFCSSIRQLLSNGTQVILSRDMGLIAILTPIGRLQKRKYMMSDPDTRAHLELFAARESCC